MHDRQRRRGQASEHGRAGPVLALPHPSAKHKPNRKAEQNAFVRPREDENRDADADQHRVAIPRRPHQTRQAAQNQRSAQRRQRTRGVVCVGPITENTQAQNRQEPSQQRPVRRQPCLQHPADGRAHQRAHYQQAHPRMPEDDLARGKNQSLPGKVHRLIGRLHGDVDAFEVRPHRGGWVRQPAVDKGVAGEQKAEIVGNKR